MSGSKWKLVGEGSSGRHLTGKRHSHRIQPRSFLSLPLLASPLSSFFLRHLFRWRVATRPFYLDNLQAREVSSLATLWMNQWTNFYGAAYSFFRRVFPMVSDVPTESSTYVWAFAGLCWSCLGESSFLPFIFVTSVICIASGPELNKQLKLTFSSSMNVLLVHIHIHPHDLVQPFACRLASPSVPFLLTLLPELFTLPMFQKHTDKE